MSTPGLPGLPLRRRFAGAVLAIGLGLGGAAGVAAAGGASDLVVRDEDGHEVVREPLPSSGRFALSYRHSYYDRPAEETFAVRGERFQLVAVASPSEAVLDYYDIAGRRTSDGRGQVLLAEGTSTLDQLPLIATGTGQRTLVTEGRRRPLFDPVGVPRHLVLRVEQHPTAQLPFG